MANPPRDPGPVFLVPMQAARRPTLLIVDDDEDTRDTLQSLFEESGFRALTAASAHDGLDMFRSDVVDGALVERRLPGMGGVTLLARARAFKPEAALFLMTGYPDPDAYERAVNEARVDGIFRKPFDSAGLLATVGQALRRRPGTVTRIPVQHA